MTVTISGAGRRFQLVGVGLVLVALLLAVFARPASAAVTGTATPSTGLGLTGTLAISAGGFDPGNPPSRPVVFVIDPKLSKDVTTITLSYTFFEVGAKTPPPPADSADAAGQVDVRPKNS